MSGPDRREVDELYERLAREAEAHGYYLNPDREFTWALREGLATNLGRYGYMACPCRRAGGQRAEDLDIICPCDYREADVAAFGACYCALYVSKEFADGAQEARPIPERRPARREDRPQFKTRRDGAPGLKVWRCRVCGYLCAREGPPEVCPICKAARDRFEPFVCVSS